MPYQERTRQGKALTQTVPPGQKRLQATIEGLRMCSAAQNELIANLEEYERRVVGRGAPEEDLPRGYQGSYGAELGYLHSRRCAIDSLISAAEQYHVVAEGLSSEQDPLNRDPSNRDRGYGL